MRAANAIDPPLSATDIERVIATMSVLQHGVVTRSELLRAGVPPDVVDRRAKTGRLRRIYQGVYLVGPIAAPRAQEMAAVLACGENAALSHWTAALCWRILPACEEANVHVIVGGHRPASRQGLRIHLVRTLHEDEITMRDNIPITTPARTLCDLSGCADQRELERALAEALALRLTNIVEVSRLLDRYNGSPGTRRLQNLLERGARPALTRSQAEEQFLGLTRRAQLHDPEVNIRLEGYEVDFFWRAERLVVEIDGRAFHSSDRTFESDRRRDAVLLAAGLRVMRVTWRQIVSEPEALLVTLARALVASPRG